MVEETLASTGTLHSKDRLFATLSGGEKQRVVIAAALAQIFRYDPRDGSTAESTTGYLLLDEPTASLDLGYQLEVAALLQAAARRAPRRHRHLDARSRARRARSATRLLLIRDGAVVASGPTDDVLTPANLRAVYGVDADVDPARLGPALVVPLRDADGAAARDAAAALRAHRRSGSAR